MKTNLFNYATRELTNDAMICWILQWGNNKDSNLYGLAKDFISLILDKEIEVNNVKLTQQYKYIDVLAIINNKYVIGIEDKIDSKEHSDQLNRYKSILQEDFKDNFNQDDIRLIYLTIGDESCYKYVRDKGYKVLERKAILKSLKKYVNKNDILDDYYKYLKNIEEEFNLYKNDDNIQQWEYRTWTGFYSYLKEEVIKNSLSNWSYVNNKNGGFCALWWDLHEAIYNDKIQYYIYLQIEESRIGFKVEVGNKEYQSEIRNYVWDKLKTILDNNENYSGYISKTRFQKGNWMTIAEFKNLESKADILNAIPIVEEVNNILKNEI